MILLKSKNVDADMFDGDLILMNRDTHQVLVLNQTAEILWSAIDLLNTRDGLLDLLREAMPAIPSPQLAASLDDILDALLRGGFLQTVAEKAAGDAG
jgi:ABC-type amino acid transport substrate-binding protein